MWTGERTAVYIDLPFWNRSFGEPKAVSSKQVYGFGVDPLKNRFVPEPSTTASGFSARLG